MLTHLFRNRPIAYKLVGVTMLTSGVTLLIASVSFITWDIIRFREYLKKDLIAQAEIVSDASSSALVFDDVEAAAETLSSLSAKPSVVAAVIYDDKGKEFARYVRSDLKIDLPSGPGPEGYEFNRHYQFLYIPIALDGTKVGTLYLQRDLAELYARLRAGIIAFGSVVVGTSLIALLLSYMLQRIISRPLVQLTSTAREISTNQDYSLRAHKYGNDELGQLVDIFNEMLSQIQERDAQLIKVNENLEQTVHNRTMELEKELGERKRAEEQLGKLNEELSQSNQELDNFAYIASHDLKEPLRGIHNYSAFLLEDYGGKFDPDGQSKLETLKRLTQRMEDIINSLLQFSRVGRVDLALRDVDLNEVISEVVNLLDISLKEQNVKIIIPEPLPVIYCDRARIGEVFQNLITNGMKYNVSAEKRIEIGTVAPDHFDSKQVNSEVVFYVRDNGIGIPPKHHENVFNIFKRLHSREKYGGGTGAGLTIVKKIVERHHGSIWIESEQGAGTTFYFTLETRSENLERTSSAYTGS